MFRFISTYILSILMLWCLQLDGQTLPSDTVAAKLVYDIKENNINFSSELRPLRAIAGAPLPFYTYFWEFGDGNFSFDESPKHFYSDSGSFSPRLYATNNYDDGKPPPTRPGSIKIKSKPASKTLVSQPSFFKSEENLALKTNRMPRPEEEMVLILGYKNPALTANLSRNGTLVLFYNDVEFTKDNFKIIETRTHHNEQKTSLSPILAWNAINKLAQKYYAHSGPNNNPAELLNAVNTTLLKEKLSLYKNSEAWTYENLEKDEERFMFLSIQTTPEMIKDTNAVVTLSVLMIPDDMMAEVSSYDLELQIVASHDPNKMILKNRFMNYRFIGKNKELTYKVKFQNTGKGPAKLVNIGIKIPEVLDKSSIKVLDTQPAVVNCSDAYTGQSCLETVTGKDSVNFIFRNIYLPGLQQDGVNDKDSTKGYVEYKIKFIKKPKKIPFKSGAAIIFDRNEPIYTNQSKGRFLPGISPGIISGFGFLGSKSSINELGNKNVSLGFSISPYSPYRKYLQAEIYVNSYNYSNELLKPSPTIKQDTVINNREIFLIDYREFYKQNKRIDIDLVPIQVRYNVNSFIGLGIGGIASFTLTENNRYAEKIRLSQTNASGTANTFDIEKLSDNFKKNFADINSSIFADIQIGLVRKGPALGFRYIKSITLKDQRMFTYLSWKI
jgi:PKD repeat protein